MHIEIITFLETLPSIPEVQKQQVEIQPTIAFERVLQRTRKRAIEIQQIVFFPIIFLGEDGYQIFFDSFLFACFCVFYRHFADIHFSNNIRQRLFINKFRIAAFENSVFVFREEKFVEFV